MIAPVALSILMAAVSGIFVGPCTTDAPFAGSNSAPWQEHISSLLPGSYWTGVLATWDVCLENGLAENNYPNLWWLLRSSVRKMAGVALDCFIFPEL